jgi:hypothetical protein
VDPPGDDDHSSDLGQIKIDLYIQSYMACSTVFGRMWLFQKWE